MKYVVIPFIKTIMAIFITLVWIVIVVIRLAWNLNYNFKYKYDFWDFHNWEEHISPFYNGREKRIFKSYFHYIWNIK